jgi:hypothetical protein
MFNHNPRPTTENHRPPDNQGYYYDAPPYPDC